MIQIPVVRLIPDPNPIPILFQEVLFLPFVEEIEERIGDCLTTAPEIGLNSQMDQLESREWG